MKRFALAFLALFTASALFAQADLQVLAVVKLNKNESITVKQLKTRVEAYQKQRNGTLSVDDRKKVLDAMIQEKLVIQAAAMAGITIPDSTVEQYFLQSVSQSIGKNVTEQEFEQLVKAQTNMSLDEYMKQQSGMSVADYKTYLKNQLIAQQYILSQRQKELQSVSPTDEEIRAFYELNKTSFVWTDMFKMFLVIVPKGTDAEAARIKANSLYDNLKNKKITVNQITVDSKKENSGFQAGDVLVNKSQMSAQQLGISYGDLLELFKNEKGYISEVAEQETNFQFFTIVKKYEAKMLSLSDVVQPETTVTVYDYIKQSLGQQKQMEYLTNAAGEIAASLDTEANVERKKKGADLDKLLNW
ncbi:MAG: peptidyl-prolyl cis-trans isomerase [Treponema porcinum]|uniref:MOSP complex formation periplasmic protein, TDE1658 family n=2 Tax=Treponema porcinum TaxID=261392 RepID=UPI00235334FC|nr:peptidyl-prolyl cis-trans isomerase [Treponema porcinum]MCI6179102.1 peptidyl-prolyl cis-trans isomerase [Treponema porcinum]MCI6322974.1 peptidyl-prolyl cis-trans isomerase [Treponema porcinum]MCI6721951.1 peptidyl-prolyl cis-trans isomerase [Treponema porcinum]MCI7545453.1 peptidyl-prolyl cis-trans isomerase [Treponema porcinum]MDY4189841.1 peptidyl-prolyl cis-trans isomerase [Treponema porcinum]